MSAREAEGQARRFADVVQETLLGAPSTPEAFADIAAQAAEAHRALSGARSHLGWLRPLEWIPIVGARLRQARDTAELGAHIALGVQALAVRYEGILRQQAPSSSFAALGGEAENSLLTRAEESLHKARDLLRRELLLDDQETALAVVGVPLLQAALALARESPEASNALLDLMARADRLSAFSGGVWDLVANAESLAEEAGAVVRSARVIERESARLAASRERAADALGLAAAAGGVVADLAEAGESLAGVVRELESGFLSTKFGAAASSLLTSALASSEAAVRDMSELRQKIEILMAAAAEGPGLASIVAQRLDEVADRISRLDKTAHAIYSALGYGGPRVYLVVFQNQNEIRATGGFVGVTVEMHVADGVLLDVVYQDSTNLDPVPLIDNPAAPEPLYWYLWMGRLLFRDANWSPHFPESAETLRRMYKSARGVEVDGVIAGTKLLAWEMVDVLGGVYVPYVDQPLDRQLAEQYTEGLLPYPCEEHHVSGRDKRCFDQDLTFAILERLQGQGGSVPMEGLLDLVLRHLSMKDLLIYMVDPLAAALVAEQRWDGAVQVPAQDFLMVVDSSLPGHTTADIERTWDYRVTLNPVGLSRAELLVRYENLAPQVPLVCRQTDFDAGGCYWNYVRVYLAAHARDVVMPPVALHEGTEKLTWGHVELDSARVFAHADGPLRGLTEAGAYLTVEPGSLLTFPVTYNLAPGVVQRLSDGSYRYRLLLSKQPGMDHDLVRVRVQLPPGASVVSATPGARTEGGLVSWDLPLIQDTELQVTFNLR